MHPQDLFPLLAGWVIEKLLDAVWPYIKRAGKQAKRWWLLERRQAATHRAATRAQMIRRERRKRRIQ